MANEIVEIAASPKELETLLNSLSLPANWMVATRGSKLVVAGQGVAGPPVYSPEYQAILDYATSQGYTLPSADNKLKQDTLLVALKAGGVWTQLDLFYNFVTDGDLGFACINWKAPGTFNAVVVGTTPVLHAMSGIQFNGNQHLDTGWIPATHGVNFTQNNAGLGAEITSNLPASAFDLGCSPNGDGITSAVVINPAGTAGTGAMKINTSVTLSLVNGRSEGLYQLRRTTASATACQKDGGSVGSDSASTSVARPAFSLYIGATNGAGTIVGRTSRRIGMVYMTNNGILGVFRTPWIAYYHPYRAAQEYQAILDYATSQGFTLPSAGVQAKQLQLIRDLMDMGTWNFLDTFYNFATDGSEGFARINWKAPGTFQCTAVGVPDFLPKTGFQFTALSYLDTGWKPGVNGNGYQQNDAGFGCYIWNNIDGSYIDMGCSNSADSITNGLTMNARGGGNFSCRVNGNASFSAANASSGGFYHITRSAAASVAAYKNGVLLNSAATVSTARPTVNLWIGAGNGNGVPVARSVRTMGMAWTGASLTGRGFYTQWTNYLTGL